MGLFRRLFGKRDTPPNDTSFSRGPKAVNAEPGTEEATFLREASVILGCEPDAIDLSKDIQADYGCDEPQVIEFLQIAKDIWGVSLMDELERAAALFRSHPDYAAPSAFVEGIRNLMESGQFQLLSDT